MDIAVQEWHTCLGSLRAMCSTNDPAEAFRNCADLGVATGHDPGEKHGDGQHILAHQRVRLAPPKPGADCPRNEARLRSRNVALGMTERASC